MKTFKGASCDEGTIVTLGSITYDPDRPPKILTRRLSVEDGKGKKDKTNEGKREGKEVGDASYQRESTKNEEDSTRSEGMSTSEESKRDSTSEDKKNERVMTRRRSEEDDISKQRRHRREAREHARRRSEEIEQRDERSLAWRFSEEVERGKKEGQRSSTRRRSKEDEETERRKKKEGKARRLKEDEETERGRKKEGKVPKRKRFEEILNLITVFEPAGLFARRNIGDEVASYGIILVYEDETSFHYFACRRRATLEFAEMIKCGPRKVNLYEYLSYMTIGERELLCTHSHEDLWNDLLFETGHLFPETPKLVAELFEYYYTILPDLLSLTNSDLEEPYYEFPKGRHSPSDGTLLATAVREMKEEVGIDLGNSVDLALPLPIVDRYVGTDGNAYVSNYFVIKTSTTFEPTATMLDEPNVFGEWYLSEDMAECKWIALRKGLVKKRSTQLCERLETLLFDIHVKLCGLC
jgi:hypothetical protein